MDLTLFKKFVLMNGMDSRMTGVYLEYNGRYYWVSEITKDAIIFTSISTNPMPIMSIVNTEGEGERNIFIKIPNLKLPIPITITGMYIDSEKDLMLKYEEVVK